MLNIVSRKEIQPMLPTMPASNDIHPDITFFPAVALSKNNCRIGWIQWQQYYGWWKTFHSSVLNGWLPQESTTILRSIQYALLCTRLLRDFEKKMSATVCQSVWSMQQILMIYECGLGSLLILGLDQIAPFN